MSLDDAADAGLVRAQFVDVAAQPPSEPDYETKTYAIGFVVDQVSSVTASSTHNCTTTVNPVSDDHQHFSNKCKNLNS